MAEADNNQVTNLPPEVRDELAGLFLKLSHEKKSRPAVGRLIKEYLPDSRHAAAFKDIDMEDQIAALRQEHENREIESARQAAINRMAAQKQRLLDGSGDGGRKYSEDDMSKIEALMQKKGLTDYDDAATLYSASQPQPRPTDARERPHHGSTWEFPEWARFAGDPVKASREVADEVIGEIIRNRR